MMTYCASRRVLAAWCLLRRDRAPSAPMPAQCGSVPGSGYYL